MRRLDRLRLAASRRFAGAAGGLRRSLRHGASLEFADYREYVRGDDIRRIDWNVFARLEELVLRLYVAEEDLHVYLLVDRSASMAFGSPSKLDVAKRVAAALAYVGLSGNERVSVLPFDKNASRVGTPARGKSSAPKVFRHLEAIEAQGETDLRASLEFLLRTQRPGLVVLVSDLFDPSIEEENGLSAMLDPLVGARFEVSIIHVLSEDDVKPSYEGDLLLVDGEGQDAVELSVDGAALKAYQARLSQFLRRIESYASSRGIRYLRLEGDEQIEERLARYLSHQTQVNARGGR